LFLVALIKVLIAEVRVFDTTPSVLIRAAEILGKSQGDFVDKQDIQS
jgi:hypothetical protein